MVRAYYNENDSRTAAWLRELASRNLIAPGDVDERSIDDVSPKDLEGYTQCHFFAGIGVWSFALRRAGWPDEVQVWTGSCPCQPFASGGPGAGFDDPRHLWPSFFHLIRECCPVVVLGEQVASKGGRLWLDFVSHDLEAESYAVGATVTVACGFGAPHKRQRLYWVAESELLRCNAGISRNRRRQESPRSTSRPVAHRRRLSGPWSDARWVDCEDGRKRPIEPGTVPLAYGAPARMGRLRGYGNALCTEQAQAFIESYLETIS